MTTKISINHLVALARRGEVRVDPNSEVGKLAMVATLREFIEEVQQGKAKLKMMKMTKGSSEMQLRYRMFRIAVQTSVEQLKTLYEAWVQDPKAPATVVVKYLEAELKSKPKACLAILDEAGIWSGEVTHR